MRSITRRKSSAGVTEWIFLDHRKEAFSAALAFLPSSGAVLTGRVEHMFSHPHVKEPVTITRVTTTATLRKVNHGLSVGDYLVVEGAGAPFDGQYSVASVVDADNVTYTVANSGLTTAGAWAVVGTGRIFVHETMVDMTARMDSNYAMPPTACRLNLTAYTSGFADLVVVQRG